MNVARFRHRSTAGLTLIELVIAMGLLTMLVLGVVQLFDSALSAWRRGEARRAVTEQATIVADRVGQDLRGAESGPRGDLLVEWVGFDVDGDGVRETKWPRVRLVREASAAEIARIRADEAAEARTKPAPPADEVVVVDPEAPALVEVLWMAAPASRQDLDARSTSLLWRGVRRVADLKSTSFFDPHFFGASNLPPAGSTDEVTDGVLWMDVRLAAQTSVVNEGWNLTRDLSGVATSWDAWGRDRPDASYHGWNEKAVGMPKPGKLPILPRRVRLEFEFERPADRIWRTRLVEAIDDQAIVLRVDDGKRVPVEPGSHVLIDAEWMKITSVEGGRVVVERGARATPPVAHAAQAMVHWGLHSATEVVVATYREDWNP